MTDVLLRMAFDGNNHMAWGNLMVVFAVAAIRSRRCSGLRFYSYKENEGIVRCKHAYFLALSCRRCATMPHAVLRPLAECRLGA